jgi:hypothetical protein
MKRARVGLMGCGTVVIYGHLPPLVGTKGLEMANGHAERSLATLYIHNSSVSKSWRPP